MVVGDGRFVEEDVREQRLIERYGLVLREVRVDGKVGMMEGCGRKRSMKKWGDGKEWERCWKVNDDKECSLKCWRGVGMNRDEG